MDGQLVKYDLPSAERIVLTSQHEANRYNAPNDLVIDRNGGIYFTDPRYRAPEPWPQGTEAVYYYEPKNGVATRLVDDRTAPNGVILSIDEQTLYVIPSMEKEMWSYPVLSPGKLEPGRVFCEIAQAKDAKTPGGGDGLTIDTNGNLYITTALGLQVFNTDGKPLGIIEFPEQPSNVTFGGRNNGTLFVTARKSLYSVTTGATGHVFPGSE